jgi:CBS domain-containing protein
LICAVCGHENLQGEDECANCGSDLRTVDIPHPGEPLEARLMREQLEGVGADRALTVERDAPVSEVIALMQEHRNGCVVVMADGGIAGVFTERDALVKLAGRSLDGVTVGELMTPDPVVLGPDDGVAVAIHKMAVGGFRHIPLVVDGRPVGVATTRDLLRHIDHLLG